MRRALRFLLLTVVCAGVLAGLYIAVWLRERHGRGGPIPVSQAGMLLAPGRRRMHPPRQMLAAMGLREGQTALELGPGPGYFSPEAARILGAKGRLVCIDIQPGMLALLRRRLGERDVGNASPVAGDATRLPLADESIDMAFLVTVLGEIPDRPAALQELYRTLRPGGTVAFVESLTDPDYVFIGTLTGLCRTAGFEPRERQSQLLGYSMTFRRPRA